MNFFHGLGIIFDIWEIKKQQITTIPYFVRFQKTGCWIELGFVSPAK